MTNELGRDSTLSRLGEAAAIDRAAARHDKEHESNHANGERRFEAHLREHDLMLAAHVRLHAEDQRAIDKAEQAIADRFSSVNAFRDQQRDIIAGFVQRVEFSTAMENVTKSIESLNTFRDQTSGRGFGFSASGTIIVQIIVALGVVAVLVKDLLGK